MTIDVVNAATEPDTAEGKVIVAGLQGKRFFPFAQFVGFRQADRISYGVLYTRIKSVEGDLVSR